MPINTLPTPPTRQDPANFADRADTFLAALPNFATEANQLATEVNVNASSASVSATNAQAAATAAQASAGVTLWNAGTSYTVGQTVYSPTTFYTYRRKIAGQTATDPSSDATNWVQVTGTGNVSLNGTDNLLLGDGSIGIGTNSPAAKLHISSVNDVGASIVAGSAKTASLNIAGNNASLFSSSFDLQQSSTGASFVNNRANAPMSISTNNIERIRIQADGNVCLGTSTTPVALLHVNSSVAATQALVTIDGVGTGTIQTLSVRTVTTGTAAPCLSMSQWRTSFTAGDAGQIRFDGLTTTGSYTQFAGITARVTTNGSSGGTTFLDFSTSNVGSNAVRATLDNTGNFGIGTIAPTTKLHVVGALSLSIPTFVSAGTYSITTSDSSLRFANACTVTLPLASAFVGRIINLVTVSANAIVAVNTTNGAVVPLTSASGGTAILPATSGKCVTLQSDGSNWIAIAGN